MAIQGQTYLKNPGFPLNNGLPDGLNENQFVFNTQPQQVMQLQQHRSKKQHLLIDYNAFPPSLDSEIEKHMLEMDQFLNLQNYRLRWALQEQRKQQIAYFLKNCELNAQFLLKQKDEEIVKVMNRAMELEDFVKRMESENQTWQRLAKENEAMVMSLQSTIEHLKENASSSRLTNNGAEDVESCCDVIEYRRESDQENEDRKNTRMICRNCDYRISNVIILPCRHLCMCKDCDNFINSCPVCKEQKKASVKALF